MTPKQISSRIHEDAPWESPNVYHRDLILQQLSLIYVVFICLTCAILQMIKQLKIIRSDVMTEVRSPIPLK
jgi:hypothetical protein